MPFVDRKPSWKSILLLLLLVPPMYLLIMGVTQVRLTDEALVGAFVQDFISSKQFAVTRIYGQTVPGFPLYSWFVSLCSGFGMPNAFLLRLPALISLVVLAVVSGLFARRHHSGFAGVVAASVVLTSVVSFKIGTLAHVEIVGGLLLSCAWYSLFVLGFERRKWAAAWIVSLFLVFVATFGIGAKAIIIFYFPLFFTGRKIDCAQKMQTPQHVVTAGIFVLLLGACKIWVPTQPFLPWNAQTILPASETLGGYMGHICTMFPKIAYYLFPWTFVAWAPFCIAMRQFEHDNKMCHFMRTIVFSNLLMFWLLPGGSPLHLIPVFGPLAVLIGVHAEVVFRRHQRIFGVLLRLAAWIVLAMAIAGLLFWLGTLRPLRLFVFEDVSGESFPAWLKGLCILLNAVVILCIGHLLFIGWNRRSLRSCLLWCIFAARMTCLGTWQLPAVAWDGNSRKVHGCKLAEVQMDGGSARSIGELLKQDGVEQINLYLPSNKDIPKTLVETFYLRAGLKVVRDVPADIPEDKTAYLLSPFQPAHPALEWETVSPVVNLNARRTVKGELLLAPGRWKRPFVVFRKSEIDRMPNAAFSSMCIYRGVPKATDK